MASTNVPRMPSKNLQRVTACLAGTFLFATLGATQVHAAEVFEEQAIPQNTEKVWIDVESPAVSVENTTVKLVLDGQEHVVEIRPTSFGVGAVIEAPSNSISLAVDTAAAGEVEVTLTYEGADNTQLGSQNRRIQGTGSNPVDPESSPSPSPDELKDGRTPDEIQDDSEGNGPVESEKDDTPDTDSSSPKTSDVDPQGEKKNELSITGFALGGVAILGLLLVAGGAVITALKRRAGEKR